MVRPEYHKAAAGMESFEVLAQANSFEAMVRGRKGCMPYYLIT